MKKVTFIIFLFTVTVMMAQSLVTPNPPVGQQFYDTFLRFFLRQKDKFCQRLSKLKTTQQKSHCFTTAA